MEKESETFYHAELKKRGITPIPLQDLIDQSQLIVHENGKETVMTGEEYWKEYGHSWYGEFDLDRNSESVRRLRHYRRLKSHTKPKVFPVKSL
jgi:hypothetical protein